MATKFKVGDKVKTKVRKHGIPKDTVAEIVDYKSMDGYLLKGWAGRFLASELELESSTPQFKVGDKVKIVVGCQYEYQGKKNGVFLEGEILKISPNSALPYSVKWSDDTKNSYGSYHLQLDTPEKTLSKFKVGDIVVPVGEKQIGYNDDGTKRDDYDLSWERRIVEVKGDMIRLDGDFGIWFKTESWELKGEKQVSKETVKPKFEEGKIYYHEFKGESSYIFKCSKTGDEIYSYKGRIDVKESSFSSRKYNNNIGTSFREATPKEQKWFNVCSYMDTFVSMRELDNFNDDGTPNISQPYFGEVIHPTPSIYASSVDAGVYVTAPTMFTDIVTSGFEEDPTNKFEEDPTNKYQVMEQQDAIILNRGTKKKKIFVI